MSEEAKLNELKQEMLESIDTLWHSVVGTASLRVILYHKKGELVYAIEKIERRDRE